MRILQRGQSEWRCEAHTRGLQGIEGMRIRADCICPPLTGGSAPKDLSVWSLSEASTIVLSYVRWTGILCENCLVSADIISIFVLFSAVLLALLLRFIHHRVCNTSW
jgi:TRAP-type uncharacterized transport system fused permease subunit